MAQIEIEFISEGFKEILNSDGVRAAVENAANDIKNKADANISGESEGFSAHAWKGGYGGGRWVASVTTTDLASMQAEAENKALTKAVK